MADNTTITPGSGATVAADLVGGALYQRIKLSVGSDGSADDNDATHPAFVQLTASSALIGKAGIDQTTDGTTNATRDLKNLGAASVATNLFVATAAGSVSLSKAKWPGPFTVTLPAVGSGIAGITPITESAATIGGVFSPGSTWGGVILNFAGVGAADLTATVEIGRLTADATMPTILGAATALKTITTSGTFTANFNPFTGAAVSSTTYRLFDLITLNSRSNLGELLVNVGGAEDDTPGHILLDTTVFPYYFAIVRSISTLTQVLCTITPVP